MEFENKAGVEVSKREANKVRKILLQKKILLTDYFPVVQENSIIFPIILSSTSLPFVKNYIEIHKSITFEKRKRKQSHVVEEILSEEELKLFKFKSFSIIGQILIIERFPESLLKKVKEIGALYLDKFAHIKTVVRKVGKCHGEMRLQEYEVVAGEKTFQTCHKEYGLRMKTIINKVFFSYKIAEERKRVALSISPTKDSCIFIPFSGIAPFAIVCCHFRKNLKKVVCVELNSISCQLAKENIKINRMEEIIEVFNEDVVKFVSKIKPGEYKFDKIIIPMPRIKGVDDLTLVKKLVFPIFQNIDIIPLNGTRVFLYCHVWEEKAKEFSQELEKMARERLKGVVFRSACYTRVGVQQHLKFYRFCMEFTVQKKE